VTITVLSFCFAYDMPVVREPFVSREYENRIWWAVRLALFATLWLIASELSSPWNIEAPHLFLCIFNAVGLAVVRSVHRLALDNEEVIDMLVKKTTKREIQEWPQPTNNKLANKFIKATDELFGSVLLGLDNVPTDGRVLLFVCNHELLGLELGCLVNGLLKEKNIYLRGLGDHFHFRLPHAPIFQYFGAIDGTRANFSTVAENKQHLLVYPGGGREVLKEIGDDPYELMWKDRVGFARMAIKHGCVIVPTSTVGPSDMMDILFSVPIPFTTYKLPIVRPKALQRCYIKFGTPIETEVYNGQFEDRGFAEAVRDATKAEIEVGLKELLDYQAQDPHKNWKFRPWAQSKKNPNMSLWNRDSTSSKQE